MGSPLRPDTRSKSPLGYAVRRGLYAARQNLVPMLVLEAAMAATVAIYYCWPAGATILSCYAEWQKAGGLLLAALASGLTGGIISEVSLVYGQDKGCWSFTHLDHMGFKFGMFFISGACVYEFYAWQAIWFGKGTEWSVLVPKILVDQFGYTIVWAVPFVTLATRWHNLRYSGRKLLAELNGAFIIDRILPVLVTNWMFWLPGVTLIYSMPSILQVPLFIFATAIWGLLLPAVARQNPAGTDSSGR